MDAPIFPNPMKPIVDFWLAKPLWMANPLRTEDFDDEDKETIRNILESNEGDREGDR